MPETQTDKKLEEELEKGQTNFQDFLEVFDSLREGIEKVNESNKALLTVITEDLIPAVDELTDETKTSRVIMAQLQGKKQPKPSILDNVAQEIFGGSE
jgi:hypothetical protein